MTWTSRSIQTHTVQDVVSACLSRRDFYLELAQLYGSPLYVIEEAPLLARAREFCETFRACLPDMKAFFPVKANSHPDVLKTMLKAGLEIEVSSGIELEQAVAAGAGEILFNGPAKTMAELDLALQHRDRVTVIMDSGTELERLASLAADRKTDIRTGIRLAVETQSGLWRKFGINPAELPRFADQAANSPHISLNCLHFHTSWNMNPSAQTATLQQLGKLLRELPAGIRQQFEFIDIGGGFWPSRGEWLPTPVTTDDRSTGQSPFYTTEPAVPLSEFAAQISHAFQRHIFPHLKCRVYTEPGRWICSDGASILLTVLDLKGDDIAITDGGTNMVGWEQFEYEYFPVINLSRPEPAERPFLLLGSLCTPRDLWGRSYFGSDIRRNDLLLIPMQGAYTYSLRQQFIKPHPHTLFVPADSDTEAPRENQS